jgi:putative membrane protein
MSLFSEHWFLVLAAFLVGALLLTSYGARRQRVWTPKRVHPEIAL